MEKDIVVYKEDTNEIIAIIQTEGNKAVFKKGYNAEKRDSNEKYIIGDGRTIYLENK